MNRIVILFLIFIFSCELLISPEINIISESDFIELQNSGYTLIDVRTQDEFDLGHINSAINLDFYSDTFKNDILSLPKNETIVLYCRTNNRSSKTATILQENGYRDILVIKGGINEWVKNGNDINYTKYSE
jgi:rhodanese-related sulfurtransferase